MINQPSLPPIEPMENSCFAWGDADCTTLRDAIKEIYMEVIHRRRNSSQVSLGKVGNLLWQKWQDFFEAFSSASALESTALWAVSILPISFYNDTTVYREWFKYRAGQFTFSHFRYALHINCHQARLILLMSICYPEIHQFITKANSYGCKHERLLQKLMKKKCQVCKRTSG